MKQEIRNIISAINANNNKAALESLFSVLSDKTNSAYEAKKIAVAKKLYIKEDTLTEKVIKTRYDREYQQLIKDTLALPWVDKPYKGTASAGKWIEGQIGSKYVAFNWHFPDTKWGPDWAFIDLIVSESQFSSNRETLFNVQNGMKTLEFSTKSNKSDAEQRANIQLWKDAIAYCKKIK